MLECSPSESHQKLGDFAKYGLTDRLKTTLPLYYWQLSGVDR
jgi:hypothetical protein